MEQRAVEPDSTRILSITAPASPVVRLLNFNVVVVSIATKLKVFSSQPILLKSLPVASKVYSCDTPVADTSNRFISGEESSLRRSEITELLQRQIDPLENQLQASLEWEAKLLNLLEQRLLEAPRGKHS